MVIFIANCSKSPTKSQLVGSWQEETNNTDKAIITFFEGDTCYFSHDGQIDSLTYTLDEKHNTLFFTFIHHPERGTSHCNVVYHKRKDILSFTDLFPKGSKPSKTSYFNRL